VSISTDDIYRCLALNSADGLVVSDLSGKILSCNPAFTRLVGKDESQLAGFRLEALIEFSGNGGAAQSDTTGSAENRQHTSGALTESQTNQGIVITANGMDLTMPLSHLPVTDRSGTTVGYLTVVYIVQAGSVQQAQTEFVSTVSHELRTPLTSIKGFADTILRAGDRLDVSHQRRYVGIIKDQADRLTRLVEDLLAASRLESRKLQLTIRAIDLEEAIGRVCRNLDEKASNHHISVSVQPGTLPVWADADRLEQILTNLIDNAIKYSPPRTTVSICARNIGEDAELVEISVADQGVGIPEEHLPHIFSKFSRLDNPLVRQTEGTGLGLFITKALVLALGGQIRAASSVEGTEFTVELPAASLEEQAARGRGQAPC